MGNVWYSKLSCVFSTSLDKWLRDNEPKSIFGPVQFVRFDGNDALYEGPKSFGTGRSELFRVALPRQVTILSLNEEEFFACWSDEKPTVKTIGSAPADSKESSDEKKEEKMETSNKATLGGIEVEIVEVIPGLRAVSALAHELVFTDETKLAPNPELAKKIKAAMKETITHQGDGFTFVDSIPEPDTESLRILREFAEKYPGIKVVSSMLSVQAFRKELPQLVIGSITTPETSRLDNPLKRIFRNKWQA